MKQLTICMATLCSVLVLSTTGVVFAEPIVMVRSVEGGFGLDKIIMDRIIIASLDFGGEIGIICGRCKREWRS